MHTVRKSLKDDERMETAQECRILTTVLTLNWEPWSANKCSEKDASFDKSGWRNSIFKISKYDTFINMCQLTSSSYVQPKQNGPKLLGVDSKWGAPSFAQPKKNSTLQFISDPRNLNIQIKRKPYPIPKPQEMLLNLEGFKYSTSLDYTRGIAILGSARMRAIFVYLGDKNLNIVTSSMFYTY